MITEIERKLSNGAWDEENETDRINMFLDLAATRENLTREQVISALEAGKELRVDTDWYAVIRMYRVARVSDADRQKLHTISLEVDRDYLVQEAGDD